MYPQLRCGSGYETNHGATTGGGDRVWQKTGSQNLLALNAIGVTEVHIVKKIAQFGKQRVITARSVDILVPAAGQARFVP